jgi:peptide/nickel transport system permease protein
MCKPARGQEARDVLRFILLRLGQAVLTVFGVMILTFLLFRTVAGDIAAAHVGEKASEQTKAEWRHRYGYDKPLVLNVHRRLMLVDRAGGQMPFRVSDPAGSEFTDSLAMTVAGPDERPVAEGDPNNPRQALMGRYVAGLDESTPLWQLMDLEGPIDRDNPSDPGLAELLTPQAIDALAFGEVLGDPNDPNAAPPRPGMAIRLSTGESFRVFVDDIETAGGLIEAINSHPDNAGRVRAGITEREWTQLFDSQFFHHLVTSVTFSAESLKTKEELTDIIVERAPKSLALTIPAMALGWVLAMVISSVVAYFRGTMIDKVVVFLSVLGMCIPFLAIMIYGQWFMFQIAPTRAYGIFTYKTNIYVPVAIMVLGGLGASVRFYRTVILDETNRDYVRTARAKGLPLTSVLFRHILKNAMLPILTRLILSIPFLIMGSLLVEQYFGIPGLGDLMLTSITERDEPIMSGLVFLLALIYTIGLLLTDLSYALFDPRIRLR